MNRAAVLAFVLVAASVAGCDGGSPTRTPAPSPRASAPANGPGSTGSGGAPASGGTTAPSATPGTGPFDPASVQVAVETVVDGLDAPLGIAHAGDGSGRLFVVQQGGQIRIVRNGALEATPFLDIADRISSGGERGLLGLAFHPDFPSDPRLFVNYTDQNGDTRISSFRVDPGTPDRADPASERRLLFVQQPAANHNGGAVAFGPDGFLIIALGDGGGGGDPQGNGQNPAALLGKILRIDVDGTAGNKAYAIPADNPYADGTEGQPEIWLGGLRNPWRLSFDRATGDLWIGDVGQNEWEEVDVQRARTPGGTNFGWNRLEATHCFGNGCDEPALTGPVTEYGHGDGCTVIGGNVYRGSAQAALAGGYLFGDYCSGRLWAIDPASDAFRPATVVGEMGPGLSAFGEDEAGELFATDINGGRLVRVTATRR
jgi:glucose/arabinose dehydrogenase